MENQLTNTEIESKRLKDAEWCFQFDEDDAQIFAWTDENMENENPKIELSIENIEGANITFTHKNGKTFKIFVREITEEGKQMRLQSKQLQQQILNENLNNE